MNLTDVANNSCNGGGEVSSNIRPLGSLEVPGLVGPVEPVTQIIASTSSEFELFPKMDGAVSRSHFALSFGFGPDFQWYPGTT